MKIKQKKPRGYWKNPENFKRELNYVIKQNKGEFPTYTILEEQERGDLITAIQKHHGSFDSVRKMMGFKTLKGHYADWKNFEWDMKKAIKENKGEFPTREKLIKLGYGGLVYAMYKYYVGPTSVRKRMDFGPAHKPDKYWHSKKNVKGELEDAIKENNGEFPSSKRLQKMGKNSLAAAIPKVLGRFATLRIKMGHELVRRARDYYKPWKVFERDMKKIIEQNNGEFPYQKELKKINGSLFKAVYKYHNGLISVRKKMGYKLIIKPHKYYKIWENVERELKKAIEENNGEFPSGEKLVEMGYNSLVSSLGLYHGGINAVRKRMDYDIAKRPNFYYRNWNVFEKDIKKIIRENNGKFPTPKEFEKGHNDLAHAIKKYHGGFPVVREKIGYNEKMRVELARDLEEIAKELVV